MPWDILCGLTQIEFAAGLKTENYKWMGIKSQVSVVTIISGATVLSKYELRLKLKPNLPQARSGGRNFLMTLKAVICPDHISHQWYKPSLSLLIAMAKEKWMISLID